MFPSGTPGLGLALLRLVVAVSLHLDAMGRPAQNAHGIAFAALLALSLLIVAGTFTPFAAVTCALAQAAQLLLGAAEISPGATLLPVEALILALLGPGAYSIDARLFGRRVFVLHSIDERDSD